MIDKPTITDDEFDSDSTVASSEGLTFKYEVLLASVKQKRAAGLNLLLLCMIALIGATLLFIVPSRSTGGAVLPDILDILPSLLVVLLFAIFAIARYVQTLSVIVSEASVALAQQWDAYHRVVDGLREGSVV